MLGLKVCMVMDRNPSSEGDVVGSWIGRIMAKATAMSMLNWSAVLVKLGLKWIRELEGASILSSLLSRAKRKASHAVMLGVHIIDVSPTTAQARQWPRIGGRGLSEKAPDWFS
jgi:hypothetical protein